MQRRFVVCTFEERQVQWECFIHISTSLWMILISQWIAIPFNELPFYKFPSLSAVCEKECQNGGTCVSPNQCKCTAGFTGATCSEGIPCFIFHIRIFDVSYFKIFSTSSLTIVYMQFFHHDILILSFIYNNLVFFWGGGQWLQVYRMPKLNQYNLLFFSSVTRLLGRDCNA